MDEVARKIAALGLPGIILAITIATTGLTGAAAITAALAMLGPGGMIGGVAFLGVVGLVTDALSKYGLSVVLQQVYLVRWENGEDIEDLFEEIDGLLISKDLKREVKEEVENKLHKS